MPNAPQSSLATGRCTAAASQRCLLPARRSNKNIYAQVIDDSKGLVLVSASTKEKGQEEITNGANCDGAAEVGKRLGARALEAGIDKVHFDRNGRLYHGRVKAVAEGAREAGLGF